MHVNVLEVPFAENHDKEVIWFSQEIRNTIIGVIMCMTIQVLPELCSL